MYHSENLPSETAEYFISHVDLTGNDMDLIDKLKIAGRILYSWEARRRLSDLLDKYPVDIAHIHNIYHHISPSILHVLKKRKIPAVMTLHDYKMVCPSYYMMADGRPCESCRNGKYFMAIKNKCVKNSFIKSALCTLEMYLQHKVLNIYKNIDIFISPSLFLKKKLKEMGFNKEIIYLPNFIDLQGNEEFKSVLVPKKNMEKTVIYFGRLSPGKGLWTLIDAARLLSQKKGMKIEVEIVGDGPLREKLEEKVKKEKINNIRFLGYLTGPALYQQVKKSLAMVLPSEWYENNPISVLESFAMGIPVIGARIGGIPELVKDNETGLTFEPGNLLDLQEKICSLVEEPLRLIEMGKRARALVEEKFNAEKHYDELMKVYCLATEKKSKLI
jgi:glycosyltransferase involved in cell wall biosynthesis